MEIDAVAGHKSCINCGAPILTDSRFCSHCGSLQTETDGISAESKWSSVKQTALFFALQLAVCLPTHFTNWFDSFGGVIFCTIALAFITILFFAYNWAENKKLLRWPNFSVKKLVIYCTLALAGSVIVQIIVGWLNITLFSKEFSEGFATTTALGRFYIILFTAVFPALFEETAFRGYMLQNLMRVIDPWQAAFVTSFLFALIHLSFVSLFWLIPFAVLLAFVRLKEKSIWYGVFIHFCFNLMACLFELWR